MTAENAFLEDIQGLIRPKTALKLLGAKASTFWRAKRDGLLPEVVLIDGEPFYRRAEIEGLSIKRKPGRKPA